MRVAAAACWMVRPRSPRFAARAEPGVTDGSPAATPTSFDAQSLQQLVDVGQRHHHLARLGALVAPDDAVLRQLVDDAPRARVADVELPLHERHGRGALRRDGASRTREQRVELALLAWAPLPLRPRAFLEDLLHVARAALRFPEVDHGLDLGVAHEGALDARRLARVDRLVEHVAAAEQLLRSARVEDHAAVDLGTDRESDAGRDVGLDEPGDDVRRRPLRRDDEEIG